MSRHDKKSCFLIEAIEAKFVCVFFFVWINNKTCNKVLVFCFHHLSFRQFLIWKVKPALFQHLDQIFMVQSTMDPQTSHWTGDFWSNFGARSRRFAGHHLHWRCLGRCSYETCARGEVAVDGHSIPIDRFLSWVIFQLLLVLSLFTLENFPSRAPVWQTWKLLWPKKIPPVRQDPRCLSDSFGNWWMRWDFGSKNVKLTHSPLSTKGSIRAFWGRSMVNLPSDLLAPIAVVVSICIKLYQVISILFLKYCLIKSSRNSIPTFLVPQYHSKWTGKSSKATNFEPPKMERELLVFSLLHKNNTLYILDSLRAQPGIRNLRFNSFLRTLIWVSPVALDGPSLQM